VCFLTSCRVKDRILITIRSAKQLCSNRINTNMSDNIMEDVPIIQNDTPMTLLNFSFEKHGFEYNFLSDFEFDDKFSEMDAGQFKKIQLFSMKTIYSSV
jgi:hypothetical protein